MEYLCCFFNNNNNNFSIIKLVHSRSFNRGYSVSIYYATIFYRRSQKEIIMKKVYKCDYCYKHDEDILEMIEHEKKCTWNKNKKACWSCEYHVDEGMPISGSMYICQKGKSYDEMYTFKDKGNCDLWQAEI